MSGDARSGTPLTCRGHFYVKTVSAAISWVVWCGVAEELVLRTRSPTFRVEELWGKVCLPSACRGVGPGQESDPLRWS